MKILLVDNNTKHFKALNKALAGHDVDIQLYRPGIEFRDHDKDLIILSGGGGEGLEIDDTDERGELWYRDEMKLIQNTKKPVIGICMGFEVMARAYDKPVPKLNQLIHRTNTVTTTEQGWKLFGKHKFKQFESHSWHVTEVPESFEALAWDGGSLGVIYNPELKQIGTQFHPELGGTITIDKIIKQLV